MERFHRTVKIKLICEKLENGKNFDIIKANNKVLFDYNNTIHSTISYKPIEIFYSSSHALLSEVYNNTLNSFKYINTDNTIFQLYEKALLNSNFIIDKNKSKSNVKYLIFNKVKKKTVFIKLCVSVCQIFENGFYNIIIEKNYENLGLEKYDICYVGSELFRKVDEEIWDEIYEK